MTLHAEVDGAGPPLVLLHGFTGSVASWAELREVLRARFRVVAIDLPGHGRSDPPAAAVRLPDVARAMVGVLDRLGVGPAHWLGYSLGGRVALHVAVGHRERVARLVLEGTSPGIADDTERAARARADEALARDLEQGGLEAFVARWTAQALFASQAPALRAREQAVRLGNTVSGLAAALRTMSVGRQTPLHDRLGAVRVPALLVVGEEDTPYRAHAEAMAARLPAVRVAVVPGAGHAAHLENPVAFAEAVTAFLADDAPAIVRPLEETHR
jgi:2-succinyl-6-hydroxy-2,4-cyclohexadiene-1-carboxylate synthase